MFRLLRAAVWYFASSGPRFGISHPLGHGLVFRLLRATVWYFASFGPRFGISHPLGHGLVFRLLRATVWCFASCGPRPGFCISVELPIAFNGCVLMTWRFAVWWCCVSGRLLDSWVSGGLQRFCISEEPTWSRTSRRLRVGAESRRDLSIDIKGGAVPAEGRGLEVLHIATARSISLIAMGRAAHCARCLRTLRFG